MTKGKKIICMELHYLPCIAYFVGIEECDTLWIDPGDLYSKQSYRNRCRINGANKVENLIVPVRKLHKNSSMREVLIDYDQKWLNRHMHAIRSAYGKAPFFEYYVDELFEIYQSKPLYLYELNKLFLTKCLDLLNLQIDVIFDDNIENISENQVVFANNTIHPKKELPGNESFRPQAYFQIFGKNFVPNLSVIDILFCEGPSAGQIIHNSGRP
jgi:hypothetical protein